MVEPPGGIRAGTNSRRLPATTPALAENSSFSSPDSLPAIIHKMGMPPVHIALAGGIFPFFPGATQRVSGPAAAKPLPAYAHVFAGIAA